MSFPIAWLDLREPADHAARHPGLRGAAAALVAAGGLIMLTTERMTTERLAAERPSEPETADAEDAAEPADFAVPAGPPASTGTLSRTVEPVPAAAAVPEPAEPRTLPVRMPLEGLAGRVEFGPPPGAARRAAAGEAGDRGVQTLTPPARR